MKTKLIAAALLFTSLFISSTSQSQVTVVSSAGYTVNIVVQPKQIVVTNGSNCTWGYNYNLLLSYVVTFSGNNIPSALHTLQGTIGCGSGSHFFSLPKNGSGGVGTLTTASNVWRSASDCATATVSSLSCGQGQITISGPGIPSQTISFFVQQGAPLPVQLVSFDAAQEKEEVKLNWATASEINSNYFEIERSTNNTNWSVIKTVKAAGNSALPLSYFCYDEQPVSGTSYYRLKETDFDGKSTYSEVRQITFLKTGEISVFPNPNKGNTINLSGINNPADYTITIYNASGASVYKAQLASVNFDTPNLNAGVYIIHLNNKLSGESSNLRYIKL